MDPASTTETGGNLSLSYTCSRNVLSCAKYFLSGLAGPESKIVYYTTVTNNGYTRGISKKNISIKG